MLHCAAATRILMAGVAQVALTVSVPVQAQSPPELDDLREQLSAMKAEQLRTAQRIAILEAALEASRNMQAEAPRQAVNGLRPSGASPRVAPEPAPSALTLNGDLRVRYELNSGDSATPRRERVALRARLRAAYSINHRFTVGGQLSTGDNDDPNSTDQTLGNFNDDLTVSLDQAYLRGTFGDLTVWAGKFPQPLMRTELVWDGDVNPQGIAASYKAALGNVGSIKANATYFLVDEAAAHRDSYMIGGQLQFESPKAAPVSFEVAVGYYDYRLASLAGGDSGDFRTNRFAAGHYLSDFNLLDVIGAVQFNQLGESWPVRIVGELAHNFGATTDQASAFGMDVLLGRASTLHDLRIGYGYAEAGVDAVLAAFSHDNTNLATNYRQHTALVDYVVMPNVVLNATYYRYKAKSLLFLPTPSAANWADRLRFSILANF